MNNQRVHERARAGPRSARAGPPAAPRADAFQYSSRARAMRAETVLFIGRRPRPEIWARPPAPAPAAPTTHKSFAQTPNLTYVLTANEIKRFTHQSRSLDVDSHSQTRTTPTSAARGRRRPSAGPPHAEVHHELSNGAQLDSGSLPITETPHGAADGGAPTALRASASRATTGRARLKQITANKKIFLQVNSRLRKNYSEFLTSPLTFRRAPPAPPAPPAPHREEKSLTPRPAGARRCYR
ncbi:hypothetical protein EVAR_65797_1 [Eumeta japonica]|uniref:Uncharacterized protein n=1 Tax=Eumeta variegata TaxID=151549 RepID=A0A4C1ZTM4_EUMVA|nr:hypothetical protein EVAR_65797_1 [Eumeta japonica]